MRAAHYHVLREQAFVTWRKVMGLPQLHNDTDW